MAAFNCDGKSSISSGEGRNVGFPLVFRGRWGLVAVQILLIIGEI